MLKTLQKVWATSPKKKDIKQDITLAVATLMVFVMQQDDVLDDAEYQETLAMIQEHFGLSKIEAEKTIQRATCAENDANDLYQFTSPLIQAYSQEERIDIIRKLWRIAMADAHIDPHEEALIRKVAELIGVHHHQFIDAKIAARKE